MSTQAIQNLIPEVIARQTITAESSITGWTPSLDAYSPDLKLARDACAKFVADMERETSPYWLTLSGVNGCGKTMLMRQVAKEALRVNPGNPKNNPIWPPDWATNGRHSFDVHRPNCRWLDEAELARKMRAGDYGLPWELRGEFFVALDELGVARDPTNFIADAVASLAENRLGRWTMFATNLTLAEVSQRIDARVASRLVRDGNRVVTINARDYALRSR